MKKLKHRIILLTGASRGLGPVIAGKLASEEGILVLNARDKEGLKNTLDALPGSGHRAIEGDITNHETRKTLIGEVIDEFGKIDILINNAAVESEGLFIDLNEEQIAYTINLNFHAPMHLARICIPHMKKQGYGHIVNISSIGGKRGAPYGALYCGTKAALDRWAESIRPELSPDGIDVSTIFPGYVTEVGMFARFNMKPPVLLGSCNPTQVANAVFRSITKKRKEVIVNSMPVRPLVAMGQLFPTLGDFVVKAFGIPGFQRRKIEKGSGNI